MDCTALEGVADVRCVDSKCLVSLCEKGWALEVSDKGAVCVPRGGTRGSGSGYGLGSSPGSVLSSALQGAELVLGF